MQQIQHHRANEEMLQLRRQIDDHITEMEDMWRLREPIEQRIMLRTERNRLLSSRKRSSNNSSDDTNGVNHTGANQQSCDHERRPNEFNDLCNANGSKRVKVEGVLCSNVTVATGASSFSHCQGSSPKASKKK